MRLSCIFLMLFFLILVFSSCTDENRLKNIESRVNKLETSDTSLSNRILSLENNNIIGNNKTALIDITNVEGGYQVVKSNVGNFLISLKDVQPYLDGLRIKINLGNPEYLTYHGAKLTVFWNNDENYREIDISRDLLPGSWNPVEFSITPTKTDVNKFIVIYIDVNSLSLFRNK